MTEWSQSGSNAFAEKNITYDANGNMVSDSRNGIRDISYNELNLPYSVSFGSSVASYLYLSDGTKIAALDNGSGYLYMGSIVCCCAFSSGASSVDFESTGFYSAMSRRTRLDQSSCLW